MTEISCPSGNYIMHSIINSIIDERFILGLIVTILSIILLIFNIYACKKMTRFYKKMNFENTIILLSIFQTIILQLVIMTSYDIIFESFFLLQIFIISLIIRKFIILASDPKTFLDRHLMFIILNVLNFILFLIYPLYLYAFKLKGHHLIFKLIYRIFHAITACILTYYCAYFIHLTAKYKENYLNSYYFFYEANIEEIDETKENNSYSILPKDKSIESENKDGKNKEKENDIIITVNNQIHEVEKEEEKEKDKQKDQKNDIKNENDIGKEKVIDNSQNDKSKNDKSNIKSKNEKKKGEEFYRTKKKQIRYLYAVNLFCAFSEVFFTISKNFIFTKDYYENNFKTIAKSLKGNLIYYIYIIVCLLNVSVNYLCFYYYIRRQYSKNPKKYKKDPAKKILDVNFIKSQETSKNDNNPDVNSFLFNSSGAKAKEEDPVQVKVEDIESPDFTNVEGSNSMKKSPLLDEFSTKF